ncbi:MAG: SAM-dependent methyltransferase, partial [Candidatus Micrarchaeia archaeon]
IILDEKFFNYGKRELETLLNSDISFKKISNKLFLFESDEEIPSSTHFIVIEGILKVNEVGRFAPDSIDYEKIIKAAEELLSKKNTFKIEVINAEFHNIQSAKDIAVKVGSELESKGYIPDLKNPLLYIYIFFTGIGTYIGKAENNNQLNIDAFRAADSKDISRAQFKLKEAINYFKIDTRRIKFALDIGAAPGGWSLEMLSRNVKVIAIDNAYLDYKFLCKDNKKCVVFADDKFSDLGSFQNISLLPTASITNINDLLNEDFSLYHIKRNINNLDVDFINKIKNIINFIMIDMNVMPKESAHQAIRFASTLNNDACLIMTIKLFDTNINKYIKDVEILNKFYKIIGIKKLPHNRNELTLYAKYNK